MPKKKKLGFSSSPNLIVDQPELRKCVEEGSWLQVENLLLQQIPNKKVEGSEIRDLFNQALLACQKNQLKDSAFLHCRLLAKDPFHADGLRNGAVVMRWLGAIGMAHNWCKRYLEIRPDCSSGLNTYGTILNDMGRYREALSTYEKALAISPDKGELHTNLAGIFHYYGVIDKAYIHSTMALNLLPESNTALLDHLIYARRVFALQDIERIDWFSLISTMPSQAIRHIFLQTLVLCESTEDQVKQLAIQKKWSDGLLRDQKGKNYSLTDQSICKRIKANSRIRIGFVSGDFRDHSVARFIWPLFKYLDRSKFCLYGYSTTLASRQWIDHFDSYSEKLADISAIDASEMCNLIRSDEIDILFDLTGFTAGSRTGALASRCAPFQLSWLGYPGSTGIPEMDYLFTDAYMAPKQDNLLSERVLLTAGSSICIESLDEIPITPVLPSDLRGYMTFGSLNNPYKFNRKTLKAWAQILSKVTNSCLLLVRKEYSSVILRNNIKAFMADCGVSGDRIYFYDNRLAGRNYLDCYNEIDITLDTYPVTGGTTTLDALWMGVPVVSLVGSALHQRVSSAILHHAGCDDLIAHSLEEFEAIAVGLCKNRLRREQLRFDLRQQLKDSLLCDPKLFCVEFARTMTNLLSSC